MAEEKGDYILIYGDKIWLLHDTYEEARRAAIQVAHYPEVTLRQPFREYRAAIDCGFELTPPGARLIGLWGAELFTGEEES